MPLLERSYFEYIDQHAIARLGGNPLLGQFPMEGVCPVIIKATIKALV